jgi:hypothetical protein
MPRIQTIIVFLNLLMYIDVKLKVLYTDNLYLLVYFRLSNETIRLEVIYFLLNQLNLLSSLILLCIMLLLLDYEFIVKGFVFFEANFTIL